MKSKDSNFKKSVSYQKKDGGGPILLLVWQWQRPLGLFSHDMHQSELSTTARWSADRLIPADLSWSGLIEITKVAWIETDHIYQEQKCFGSMLHMCVQWLIKWFDMSNQKLEKGKEIVQRGSTLQQIENGYPFLLSCNGFMFHLRNGSGLCSIRDLHLKLQFSKLQFGWTLENKEKLHTQHHHTWERVK